MVYLIPPDFKIYIQVHNGTRSNFKNICENRSKHTQIKRVINSSVFLEGYDKKSFLWIFLLKQKKSSHTSFDRRRGNFIRAENYMIFFTAR